MDPTADIKARLPIEELVGQYCQLKKKGKGFTCLCPFHNDTHPSMLVSPDKGIAYCFACQSGGDIFSFYQSIEGVDFRQALKDLGERTGVQVEQMGVTPEKKEEKDRLRECLQAALHLYRQTLADSPKAQEYLKDRGVPQQQWEQFQLGVAPDSFSDTYQQLLKDGFSRGEIVKAGLAVQKDLSEGRMYDRFRNRLMFPIHDAQGQIVGFGGRTLGEDDAKYINSSDGPLYSKSTTLYGLSHAKEAMRTSGRAVLVEGYFDVLACHRIGVENVVAVSGTALTEQHARMLKRYAETVVLCLDQDRAGKEAAERSFQRLSEQEISVQAVTLPEKDPDDAAAADPEATKTLLTEKGTPYLEVVLDELKHQTDSASPEGKKEILKRMVPLLTCLQSSVEREFYLQQTAALLRTTETALREDMQRMQQSQRSARQQEPAPATQHSRQNDAFSSCEIALGLFLVFPSLRHLLHELIPPEEGFTRALYEALREAPDAKELTIDMLDLPEEERERASILQLFCEHHGFTDWSPSLAAREIRKNCRNANRITLRRKQQDIAAKLIEARNEGRTAEEAQLNTQYQEVIKLAKMAG